MISTLDLQIWGEGVFWNANNIQIVHKAYIICILDIFVLQISL
jgi:hypothetical protein